MPIGRARELFETTPEFRMAVLAHIQEQIVIASQSAACNRPHGAPERLARWLLMTSDPIESDVLSLTQEFIAEMLGTRRTTVVAVASQLREAGALEYSRGKIRIHDRSILEKLACECYAITQKSFARTVRPDHNGLSQVGTLSERY